MTLPLPRGEGLGEGGAQLDLGALLAERVHDGLDERARGEGLAGATLGVLGGLLQQALVGVALHVRVERGPRLAVDELDDEPAQLGGVLNLVLRLAEDDAQPPCSLPSCSRVRR